MSDKMLDTTKNQTYHVGKPMLDTPKNWTCYVGTCYVGNGHAMLEHAMLETDIVCRKYYVGSPHSMSEVLCWKPTITGGHF